MEKLKLIKDALRGQVSTKDIDFSVEEDVAIKPEDLLPKLNLYLSGLITEGELQEWAGWVLTRDEFVVENWQHDKVADHYEPMWNLLQELSCPVIHGEITSDKVSAFVSQIKRL